MPEPLLVVRAVQQVRSGDERLEFKPFVGEGIGSTFLAVHDHENARNGRADLAERRRCVDGAPSSRHDVFDDDQFLTVCDGFLDEVTSTVVILVFSGNDVRIARCDTRGGDEWDGAEGDAGQFRLVEAFGERLGDEFERRRLRLEGVLVDVIV